ncbi:MAG: hypothetical protein PHN18_06125 [Sulfurospirillaceae bacterium]|jgi:hypothetical protein|nr:hypothetical protein [Sulfurospirillaceae bacterium]MDD2825890.1 hypothetical protein [Sulfurospirillaceae bacterium]
MPTEKLQIDLEKAEIEIEELAMQLADMLGVALYFAGVKREDIPKAVDVYLQGLDEVFDDDEEDGEMGFEEIIQVIEYIRKKHPKLFHK